MNRNARFVRNALAVSLGYALAMTVPAAVAQQHDGAGSANDPQAKKLDTILVTGSRNSTRTVENSSTPIDLVSAEELAATGKGDLLQALLTKLPSLSLQTYGGGLDYQVRGAMLRNLSPGYTLVLVNGKRRNVSAYTSDTSFPGHNYTDLSLIPMAAVDHIEVLRDGAAAIYGSDAIAGVVNIILKSAASGGELSVEGGSSFAGNGTRAKYGANLGLPLGSTGFVNLSLNYTDQHEATRVRPFRDSYRVYPAIGANGELTKLCTYNSLCTGTVANPAEAGHEVRDYAYSIPQYTLKSAAYNLEYGLGEALTLYSFATFSDRRISSRQNTRTPYTAWSSNVGLFKNVYPDGFTPDAVGKEKDYTGVLGLKGAVGTWDWDLSATRSRDDYKVYTHNSANYSLDYPGGATDVYSGKLDYTQTVVNLDLRHGFETEAFASPVDFSAGLEYQSEAYTRGAGERASWYGQGITAYTGYLPADASHGTRHGWAGYAGASANVTKRWYLDLAGRYEDHSDFGSVSTGRLSTRFDFTDAVAIRATVSNGFHAPSLAAQNFQLTSDTATQRWINARASSPLAMSLGSTPLKPEKSTNYSVGFTFAPVDNVHLAIDAYQIDIRDQLGMSNYVGYDPTNPARVVDYSGNVLNAQQVATIDALLAGAGYAVSPDKGLFVSYLRSVGDTRTRGVEFTADGGIPTDYGMWTWNYAINAVQTDITRREQVSPILSSLPNVQLLTEASEYNLRYRSPRYTQVAGINWARSGWNLGMNFTHYGPIKRLANNYKYTIEPKLITSLSGSYDFGNGFSVTAGVDNVFDKRTSKLPEAAMSASNKATYQWMYDSLDSISALGGYYYARIDYRF
ncbi:TonB-dependent receptor [Stenotrophomonas sp. PS02297]|uniref:TonB-dependent receptor plug domain-containing protein n=1 Tax=Stenotrophomonas sp. PS02297 TaxID=2991423 RepID=UPI00249BC1B4|nr:TonB-dependent receptor [Stenotrophomonas sp. PS02297]